VVQAAPKRVVAELVARRTPEDFSAERATAAITSLPARVTEPNGSDPGRLLAGAAAAMVILAALSASMLRLLLQRARTRGGR
jgi:hypothetical protein